MKKIIISALLAFGLFAFILPNVQASSVQGWQMVNGDWYYYISSHTTYKGWLLDKGHWYYLDSEGTMKKGWLQLDGKYYYLNETTGSMRTGWQKYKWQWYYFNPSGVMQTGWTKVNSKWYFMNSRGMMQTDWVNDDRDYYYLDSTGAMKTGWFLGRGPFAYTTGYVYTYPNGKVAYNQMVDDTYFVNDEYVWVPSKNLEKYYKPLKKAVVTNGFRLEAVTNRGVNYDQDPSVLLLIVDDDNHTLPFSFGFTPSKQADFDFNGFYGTPDSKYTSLNVDSAIALGCPLDKQSLTNLIIQALSQGGTFTEGSVTVTLVNSANLKIDW